MLPNVNETLSMLRSPLGKTFPKKFPNSEVKIPFYILTNGGDRPETVLIEKINNKHELKGDQKLSYK